MGMSVGGGEDSSMVDMNTTPLIDVMLVLLIMFIITLPIMTHAVKLDMPRPQQSEPPPQLTPPVNLEIDFDGTYYWDGTAVSENTLMGYLQRSARLPPDQQPELHIRPNKRVKYDYVARVLAAAQRMGLKKIGFAGNEEFM